MNTKILLLKSACAMAITGCAMPALANEAAAAPSNEPSGTDQAATPKPAPADIVVTGSARAQRRFDVSYAVNSRRTRRSKSSRRKGWRTC